MTKLKPVSEIIPVKNHGKKSMNTNKYKYLLRSYKSEDADSDSSPSECS